MPTGYTSRIEDGISFEQFLWGCARGMGALIMMRDDPWDAPVPERFEPSDHNKNALAEAKRELEKLKNMTKEEIQLEMDNEFVEKTIEDQKYDKKKGLEKEKYRDMIKKVEEWQPPTIDHNGLKDFMLQQLKDSVDFDCYPRVPEKKSEKPTLQGWVDEKEKSIMWDINYHTKGHSEEIARVEDRNRWIQNLRESVPQPVKN